MSPVGAATWLPAFAGRNNVWDISNGGLNFDVPNTGVAIHQKDLWLQITFFGPAPTVNPALFVFSSSGTPFTLIGGPIDTPLANGWVHQLTQWHIPVCPQAEHVTIQPLGVPLTVDQVVIDTECYAVPAPAAASLLGMSGLLALRRRRSRA